MPLVVMLAVTVPDTCATKDHPVTMKVLHRKASSPCEAMHERFVPDTGPTTVQGTPTFTTEAEVNPKPIANSISAASKAEHNVRPVNVNWVPPLGFALEGFKAVIKGTNVKLQHELVRWPSSAFVNAVTLKTPPS